MKTEKTYYLDSDYEEKPLNSQKNEAEATKTKSKQASDHQNCPICLSSFDSDTMVSLDVCSHKFCLECIQEWSKKINTCPIDRRKYSYLELRDRNGRDIVERIKVEDRTNIEDQEGLNDLTFCEICNQSTREDRMLLCDGCDLGFHCECLRPAIGDIPAGDWYCPRCVEIRESLNTSGTRASTSHRANTSTEFSTTIIASSDRLIARTHLTERVRRRVNETRRTRGTLIPQTPITSVGTSSRKSSKTTKKPIRRRTKQRKRRRRRTTKKSTTTTTPKRKRKTTKRAKKSTTTGKTLKNQVTARKTKTKRRKSKYRKRRVVGASLSSSARIGRRTLQVTASLKIKRKVLNQAKQRVLTKFIKRDEEIRGMDWSTPSASAALNNVTTDLTKDYIPMNVSVPREIESNSGLFESRPMTSQQANQMARPLTSLTPKCSLNNRSSGGGSIFESILSDIKLLHKKSDEIQVKTNGSLNLVEQQTSKSKLIPLNRTSSLNSSSQVAIKSEHPKKEEPPRIDRSMSKMPILPETMVRPKLEPNENTFREPTKLSSSLPSPIKLEKSSEHEKISQSQPASSKSSKSASRSEYSRDHIAEVSKQALKPYYVKGLIDKETYKNIIKKVVSKTESHLQTGSHMSAERISKLTVAYAEQLSKKK